MRPTESLGNECDTGADQGNSNPPSGHEWSHIMNTIIIKTSCHGSSLYIYELVIKVFILCCLTTFPALCYLYRAWRKCLITVCVCGERDGEGRGGRPNYTNICILMIYTEVYT